MNEQVLEIIGWIGVALFSLCALPQAILSWKQRSARDVSWAFLSMWMGGEILTGVYTAFQPQLLVPLLVNYSFNIVLISIIMYWKYYGGRK